MDSARSDCPRTAPADPAPPRAEDPLRAALEDWEFDDELRAVDRLAMALRVDAPHDAGPPRPAMIDCDIAGSSETSQPRRRKGARKPVAIVLAWAILSLGVVGFVFGGALLAWSFIALRGDLWAWGMPLALGGQALLLIGVVLQIDGLWQNHCATAEALDELDEQLDSLRHTTTLLGTTHSTAAQSFYAHMAGGANPQMLLADLKGQLDILAMKLAQEKR